MAYTVTAHERTDSHAGAEDSSAGAESVAAAPGVNQAEFETFVRAHTPAIARYLERVGVSRADVLDVCQQVLLLAYTKWNEFRGEASRRAWLYGIARNSAADHRKMAMRKTRAYAQFETAAPIMARGILDPEAISNASGELRLLSKVLGELDEASRETFILFEIEGLSMPEIAAIAAIPHQTGYSRLRVARDAVRRAFGQRGR